MADEVDQHIGLVDVLALIAKHRLLRGLPFHPAPNELDRCQPWPQLFRTVLLLRGYPTEGAPQHELVMKAKCGPGSRKGLVVSSPF